MNCKSVGLWMSSHMEGELAPGEAEALESHVASCDTCAERLESLRASRRALAALPRLAAPESLAARVLSRIEAENYRGLGLRSLYRSSWAARPLLLPSLVPAVGLLCAALSAAWLMGNTSAELPAVASMTVGEWNTAPAMSSPLMGASTVGLPRRRDDGQSGREALDHMVAGSLFVETVVATDGTVSEVNVLDGNQELGTPLRDALWAERFEPTRYRGRPVAVSVYRLFSRMDVRAPVT
jgi:Putative zinc-finger